MRNPFKRQRTHIAGEAEVVSGQLLIVDPAYLPTDLVRQLTHASGQYIRARAVIINVDGDGLYRVLREHPDGPILID